MGDVLEIKPYDEVECVVCKHVVRFYEDEYKKPCNYCGTWIFDKVRYRQSGNNAQKQEEEEEKQKCWLCFNKGIVEYQVQHDMGVYTYIARCTCPEGLKLPNTIPLLSECQLAPKPEFIELRNRELLGMVWSDDKQRG
jgi:hypothetical protein